MSRPPSPPPEIPGFTYVQALGTGGFADVFLYEQEMPRRRVAVKVMLADRISTGSAQEFTEEANVMAMLSTHPAIVTIYQAGVAADGRPYLVMEYCPRPNLQLRARKEPFSVAEALRVGVQVAGAVETAHRGGILHRDIKPANILVTEYNRPALTDFGIASTTASVSEATGMSIPWSPPESFAEPVTSGPRSDVYALAATVYTLLTGRSPFEEPGGRNTSADLIERIERSPLPPLGRADVPPSLQAVLERAMAKNPDARYASAVAFARALQKVQIELAHSVTPVDIIDEHPEAHEVDDDDGLTRVRAVVSISPDDGSTRPSALTDRKRPAPTPTGPSFASPPQAADLVGNAVLVDNTVLRPPRTIQAEDATIKSPPRVLASGAPVAENAAPVASAPSRKRALWTVLALLAAVLLVVGVVVAANLLNAPSEDPVADPPEQPIDVTGGIVPRVTELDGSREGDAVVFTWTNPDPQDGDRYFVTIPQLGGPGETALVDVAEFTFEPTDAGRACIEVELRRSNGTSSAAETGCVDD